MDILGKRTENPVDYQSEGTKLIYLYNRGTYGGTEVRTIEVRTEVRAYGVMAHVYDVRTVANASRASEQ